MVVVNADDFGGNDFTRAHFRALERFFEQGGKRFRHGVSLQIAHRFPSAPLRPFLRLKATFLAAAGPRGWLSEPPE
jgi:hypothetical protein